MAQKLSKGFQHIEVIEGNKDDDDLKVKEVFESKFARNCYFLHDIYLKLVKTTLIAIFLFITILLINLFDVKTKNRDKLILF